MGFVYAAMVMTTIVQSAALYFACVGIYLLVGIIFLVYWRWMQRDGRTLSVALLSFLTALYAAAASGSLPAVIPGLLGAQTSLTLEVVSYLLVNAFLAFLLWTFFPDSFYPGGSERRRTLNSTVVGAAAVTSVGLAAAAALSTPSAWPLLLAISRWVTVAVVLLAAVLVVQLVQRRRAGSLVVAIGFGFLILGSAHDAFFAGTDGRPYLIPVAFLGFVLPETYRIIRKSAKATRLARMSSERLQREVEARTKELRAASVAAQSANMAKTDLVTAITHELRTPLTSMLGYLNLLREELADALGEDQIEFFDTIEASGERLLNLVNNLLDLARIESGRIELNLEPIDVRHVIENVQDELYPLANEKNLYLETEIEADDCRVLADRQWLGLVLTNLVSNAVKYTSEGGVTIRVLRSMMGQRKAVAVKVIDTGPGISSAFMPRLFERFSREERARADAPTGTGLGLTIARELLGLMEGEIFVESKEGEGSAFSVLLPVPDGAPST